MYKISSIITDISSDKILNFSKSTNTRTLDYHSSNNFNINNIRNVLTLHHINIRNKLENNIFNYTCITSFILTS